MAFFFLVLSRLGRAVTVTLLLGLYAVTLGTVAQAQDSESSEAIKASYLADLEVMRGKFMGLAEAFPADKYEWRPMDGVRSVSEVLMLIASEGYGFAPVAFGGERAMSREESQALNAVTDKAQVIDHLTKGFAYAHQQIEAVEPATLVGTRSLFGQDRSTAGDRTVCRG